jgi:hypothetical protein
VRVSVRRNGWRRHRCHGARFRLRARRGLGNDGGPCPQHARSIPQQ